MAGAISAFIGIILGVPVVGYFISPLLTRFKRGDWINLGLATGFTGGPPRAVQFTVRRQDGWVEVQEARTCWVVPGRDQLEVFNGRCPHLGCAYSWRADDDESGQFVCPCHNGVYDVNGNVIGGPPPRPLDSMETRIQDGHLQVFYQDFRLGVATKAPL